MVEVKTFGDGSDLQLIHGYGGGGFRVSQERYTGDLFLLPRQAIAWQSPANIDKLTPDELISLMGEAPPPLLILGVGEAPMHPFADLGSGLREKGVAFEVLSTAAACRTWNVLMSEGRAAAAALVALP